jgi:NAD(P)-dependent dehydrogenase (short-subunit alcohol dehydrogenase family)
MGKVAIVTGASRGIGKAICGHLALRGFDVVVTARSVTENDVTPFPGTIGETARLVESLGVRALPVRCDLKSEDDIRSVVEAAISEFGRVDVLVNNARYEGPAMWDDFEASAWDEIRSFLDCNVKAPTLFANLLIPHMIRQGGGAMIAITTGMAYHDSPTYRSGKGSNSCLYPSTKSFLNYFTRLLGREVSKHNIAMVAISPGGTLTERLTTVRTGSHGPENRHSVHVPAVAVAHLATRPDLMDVTGSVIEDPLPYIEQHGILDPADISHPYEMGKIYDPYVDPYWLRLVAEHHGAAGQA